MYVSLSETVHRLTRKYDCVKLSNCGCRIPRHTVEAAAKDEGVVSIHNTVFKGQKLSVMAKEMELLREPHSQPAETRSLQLVHCNVRTVPRDKKLPWRGVREMLVIRRVFVDKTKRWDELR